MPEPIKTSDAKRQKTPAKKRIEDERGIIFQVCAFLAQEFMFSRLGEINLAHKGVSSPTFYIRGSSMGSGKARNDQPRQHSRRRSSPPQSDSS